MQMSTVVVGIAGGTGAGKSYLARALVEVLHPLQVALICQDSYLRTLPEKLRTEPLRHDFDRPEATDWDLLEANVAELRAGREAFAPVFDPRTHTRTADLRLVAPCPVVLAEGLLVLARPPLRALLDFKVFVDTPADVRLLRRLEKDTSQRRRSWQEVRDQYLRFVRPVHEQLVEPSRRWADLVVSGNTGNEESDLAEIGNRVRSLLHLPPTWLSGGSSP